jgi:hypothetical protein
MEKRYMDGDITGKTEAQAIFLNTFTVCSSCKQKFVVCHLLMTKQTGGFRFQMD